MKTNNNLRLYELVCAECTIPYTYRLYDGKVLVYERKQRPELHQVQTDTIKGICDKCHDKTIKDNDIKVLYTDDYLEQRVVEQ